MTRKAAHRLTLYHAGDVVARMGRRSASADGWMARHGVREAGFITACNPISRMMPARGARPARRAGGNGRRRARRLACGALRAGTARRRSSCCGGGAPPR